MRVSVGPIVPNPIEAVRTEISRMAHEAYQSMSGDYYGKDLAQEVIASCGVALAALTAAAQVRDTKDIGKYIQTITPSIEARERERMIERCAQVVDELAKVDYAEYEEAGNKLAKAAAAIRALKDKP